jgi:hypothetical protein
VEVARTQAAGGDVIQRHRVVCVVLDDGVDPGLRCRPQYRGVVCKQRVVEHDRVLAGVEAVDGVAVADACRQEIERVGARAGVDGAAAERAMRLSFSRLFVGIGAARRAAADVLRAVAGDDRADRRAAVHEKSETA